MTLSPLRQAVLFVASLLSVSLTSCSLHRDTINPDYFLQDPPALFAHALRPALEVEKLAGEGYLTFETPQGGFTGYAKVYYKRPDSLLIQLRTGYGIPIGRLLVLGDTVWIQNLRERTVYRSHGQAVPLEDFIGMKLSVDDLFTAVLGVPRLAHLAGDSLRYELADHLIRYRLRSPEELREYTADPRQGVIVRAMLVQLNTSDTVETVFSSFRRVKHWRLPRRIQIIRPRYRERLALHYRRIEVNRNFGEKVFRWNLPENMRLIDLGGA